jgi:hypothetical protein
MLNIPINIKNSNKKVRYTLLSESKIITYEHIVVKLASEEIGKSNIRELKIEKRINDHVRV